MLFTAVQILSRLMDCGASIYTVANGSYARLFSSTSKEAKELGYSIDYTAMPGLYSELKERRVFINKSMQEKLPQMACAVYSEEGIQPRIPAKICYSCQVETYVHEGDKYKFVCPKCGVETSWMGIK